MVFLPLTFFQNHLKHILYMLIVMIFLTIPETSFPITSCYYDPDFGEVCDTNIAPERSGIEDYWYEDGGVWRQGWGEHEIENGEGFGRAYDQFHDNEY